MSRYFFGIFSFLALFLCFSCNTDRRVEGAKEAVEKMKSLQIKRVTPLQVATIVDDWGGRIVKQSQQLLSSALVKSTETQALCRLEKLPKIDSLEKLYAVEIRLLGAKDMQDQSLSEKEREVLDAYLYNAEKKLPQGSNIQKLGDSVLIYNAAVASDDVICEQCFGADATKLAVWHVKFRKNEVIRKVNAKSLLKKQK
jgi:hypothetical protein